MNFTYRFYNNYFFALALKCRGTVLKVTMIYCTRVLLVEQESHIKEHRVLKIYDSLRKQREPTRNSRIEA